MVSSSLITVLVGLIMVMESVSNMKAEIIAKAENIMLETTTYRYKSMICKNKILSKVPNIFNAQYLNPFNAHAHTNAETC